jgi:hypothetical protein
MKKAVKKLKLSKETLVRLEHNLWQVAGGATANPDICGSGPIATCATCVRTCTSRLC